MTIKLRAAAAALTLLAAAAAPALGDVAPPRNENRRPRENQAAKKSPALSRMLIESGDGEQGARLLISRDMLRQLLAEADGGAQTNAAGLAQDSLPPAHTIFAGVFLSLSLVTGGLWLIRARRRPRARAAALCLAACALGGFAATAAVMANAGPPPLRQSDYGTLPRAVRGETLAGTVTIEVVDGWRVVRLIVPKAADAEE